jgi:hypothetical protein
MISKRKDHFVTKLTMRAILTLLTWCSSSSGANEEEFSMFSRASPLHPKCPQFYLLL